MMKIRDLLSLVYRLLLSVAAGISLGLLVWQLLKFFIPNVNTAERANLVVSVLFTPLPVLVLAWVTTLIVCGVLMSRPSTRPLAIKGFVVTLTLWLATISILLGGIYSTGTAYLPPFPILLAQTAFTAAGISFGLILAPVLVILAVRLAIAKVLHS